MKVARMRRTFSRHVLRPFLRFLSRIGGKVRRTYLCLIRPGEVEKALELRRGSCNHCGKCCQIGIPCPFLKVYGSHALCRIYHLGRPAPCAAFPINREDLADVDFECSYIFLSNPEKSAAGPSGLPVWNFRDPYLPVFSEELIEPEG